MNELGIVLCEDFESLTWDELKSKITESNTKITYNSDEHKYYLSYNSNRLSVIVLYVICLISLSLPLFEFLYTGGIWFLALTLVDALYLTFKKKLNPILGSVWWVSVIVCWVDFYHYIFFWFSLNLLITIVLLFLWDRWVNSICKKGMIRSEKAFYNAWMNRIQSIEIDKKEYSHNLSNEDVVKICETNGDEEKQAEALRYYDSEFEKRFGNYTNPRTGKRICGAQDYLEALEATQGDTIKEYKKLSVFELDKIFSERFSDETRYVDGMKGYLYLFDKQQQTLNDGQPIRESQEPAEEIKHKDKEYYLKELDSLIGMDSIKRDVEELINFVQMQQYRRENGLKDLPLSLHLVFSGNPGTGKTSVARILGNIYREIGVLEKGQLVEADRADLVAGYVGQTAIKTKQKIDEAMGGILFIDEAYTLNKEGNDFGQEAIDTILKAMEDYRDKFIVIVAGYPDLMKRFINSNPGLRSRFNKVFDFPDYSGMELFEIFIKFCEDYDYILEPEARLAIEQRIMDMERNKGYNFANARDVRNLFERIIANQASRVMNLKNIDHSEMMMITEEDL